MSKDNIKIIQIDTDPAVKSLKDLRKELKEYKDQMANLEEGSDAFLEIANKAGEVKHQIDEINESIKGASADFGDMVGNVSNVAAGLIGAFEAVAGGLQAMGVESEAVDETIKQMQGLMAVVQGLSAIDDGIKSLDKLAASITSTTKAAKLLKAALQPKVFLAIAAAITAVTFAFSKIREKQEEAARVQDEYNKKLAEERRIRNEMENGAFLKNLDTELRIKQAIAEVNFEDDELGKQRELLKNYLDEAQRTKWKIDNIISTGPNDLYDYEAELTKWKEAAKTLLTLIADTKANIRVLEAVEEARKKKEKNKPTTKKDDKKGLVEFTDKDLNEGLERVRKYYEEIYDIQLEQNKRKQQTQQQSLEAEIAIEKNRLTIYAEGSLEYERQLTKIFELEKELSALTETKYDKMRKAGDVFFDGLKQTVTAFGESSLGLSSKWIASLDQFQLAFKQTMDIVSKEGKAGWQSYGQVAATALGGIGTLLNAISQDQDVSTKKGFEQQKKLQIAATTMNMLSGIMAAWTSSMALPAPASFIVGGIQTAATAALGAAQIAKIKAQTMNSAIASGAINPTSVNNMIVPPVQYSAAVQGAQTEGAIKDTKVYVTESDIASTMQKVSVQESENTY